MFRYSRFFREVMKCPEIKIPNAIRILEVKNIPVRFFRTRLTCDAVTVFDDAASLFTQSKRTLPTIQESNLFCGLK